MNWYLAKITFSIHNKATVAQFDEQFKLLRAESREEAFYKARIIGLDEEMSFLNHQKQMVQWKFIDVEEIHRLDELKDGMDLYSRVHETEDGPAHTRFIRGKAAGIEKSEAQFKGVTQIL